MQLQRELESFWQLSFLRQRGTEWCQTSSAFDAFADVEAMLWLHYGVELGFFSRDDSMDILRAHRVRLNGAVDHVKRFTTANYFSDKVLAFLEQSFKNDMFAVRYADRLDAKLANPITTGLLFHEIARSSCDPRMSTFSDLITFGDDDKWMAALEQGVDPNHVLSGTGTKTDLLCAGYLAVLEHMGALDELLRYCAQESIGEAPAGRGFQSDHTYIVMDGRVRSIHVWRAKLNDPVVKTRFLELTNKVIHELEADGELMNMGFDCGSFVARIELLVGAWLGDTSFEVTGLAA